MEKLLIRGGSVYLDHRFVRADVLCADGKILAMHDDRSPYFYLPGGRVKLGETA